MNETSFWRCVKCGTPNPRAAYVTQCLGCGAASSAEQPPASSAATKVRARPVGDSKRAPVSWTKEAIQADVKPWVFEHLLPSVGGVFARGFTRVWRLVEQRAGPFVRSGNSALYKRRGRWAIAAAAVFAAIVLAALLLLRLGGETWWSSSLLMFGPRFLILAPIPIVAALAVWSRSLIASAITAVATVVALGPFMGFSFPITTLVRSAPGGDNVSILSLNRGLRNLNLPLLSSLIQRNHINVICFQEGKRSDPELEAMFSEGWSHDKRKRIYSRWPIVEEWGHPTGWVDGHGVRAQFLRVRVRAPSGREFIVANIHMPTMREGIEARLDGDEQSFESMLGWRMDQIELIRAGLANDAAGGLPILVAGDFNMPIDSPLMQGLLESFTSVFHDVGWGLGYTRPTRIPWVGIDHILASPQWRPYRGSVLPKVGSDHLPLLGDVILPDNAEVILPESE